MAWSCFRSCTYLLPTHCSLLFCLETKPKTLLSIYDFCRAGLLIKGIQENVELANEISEKKWPSGMSM
jgi:hypothetical protein